MTKTTWAAAALAATTTSAALAGGTITDGNASLQYVGSPIWGGTSGNGTLLTDVGASDQLFKDLWTYRTQNNNTNRVFSSLDTPTESYVGNTATINYVNAGPGTAGTERFNANFRIRIFDGANPGEVQVSTRLTFTASAANTAARTYNIFHLIDLDLGASALSDSVSVLNNSEVRLQQSDGAIFAQANGVGAARYQMGTGSSLTSAVTSGSTNLSTLAGATQSSPAAGDNAMAFQWTFTLNPGESFIIESSYTRNLTVPAPGAMALLALGLGAGIRRRR